MKIVTAVVNNPTFIEIQYHTLKKFLKCTNTESYEFIVFNDAKAFPDFTNGGDTTIRSKIEEICLALNIKCISIPNDHHQYDTCGAGHRCAESMNYILNYQITNPDKYLLLDSDMFLIDYLDINKYSQYDCAVLLQSRHNHNTNYIWNGIYYFDIPRMKNLEMLNWNLAHDCDVGGMMQQWLKTQMLNKPMPNTDDLRWKKGESFNTDSIYFIQHLWSCTWNEEEMPENLKGETYAALLTFLKEDVRNVNQKFFCEIYDNVFFHYRAGGNWNNEGMNLHNELTKKLRKILLS
jgi:hypothetical protein